VRFNCTLMLDFGPQRPKAIPPAAQALKGEHGDGSKQIWYVSLIYHPVADRRFIYLVTSATLHGIRFK
jgi:hypothetical protein